MLQQSVHSDITVVGGGLAGVCAAVGAARLGKTVALINNRPVLGGNSSSEIRVWVVGATAHGLQRFARETGVIGELYVENQYRNPEGNPVHWDEVVADAVRAEKNIRLFLNTDVRNVDAGVVDGERVVRSVEGWTMASEISTVFTSPYFLDCTGDGLVGYLAGADFQLGCEAKSDFGESWAPDEPNTDFLGSTILFYTKDLGRPVKFVAPDSTKDIRETSIPTSRIIKSGDKGAQYWWIEWGGELDTVHDNEVIRDELRSVVFGIWDYIKNSGEFEAETLDLEWVGHLPGKREYRRFLGDHVLTQNDILDQSDFEDAVGFGGWSIDLHPVEGMYASKPGAQQRYPDGIYALPLRCLYSRNVGNLMMAGRDISATHIAFGSARVMATCAVTGEAAGTAASLALDLGVGPRELATRHTSALQQLLLRQDASLFGVANSDPADVARSARVTASSELASIDPAEVDPAGLEDVLLPLTADTALLIPVDPVLSSVDLLMSVSTNTTLRASLWTTGRPQNSVPVDRRLDVAVEVHAGDGAQWVRLPLKWMPDEPANVIVVIEANDAVGLMERGTKVPGVLTLVRSTEPVGGNNVHEDFNERLLAWHAHRMRGRTVRARIEPPTRAYAAQQAVGGFQRPFGGPQMWVSETSTFHSPEWLRVDFDEARAVSTVRLVFDVEVDVELNTLHHHRTPEEIFPELVRAYTLEGCVSGAWVPLAKVTENRHRQRVHRFDQVEATALRVTVFETNGVQQARIVSLRAYA